MPLFCLKHNDVVYRWKVYEKTNNNMLKSVAKCGSYGHFPKHTRYHKIDKSTTTTVSRYVNELVSLRTTGHLIEKKCQVTGPYFCTIYILGCTELNLCDFVHRWNK